MGKKWEYKLEHWKPGWLGGGGSLPDVEKQLNKQGEEGWELVKFEWTNSDYDFSWLMLFKRPLEE